MYKTLITFILLVILILIIIEKYCRYCDKSLLEVLHPEWYKDVTKFPYKSFKCKSNCKEYINIIKNGYTHMKDKKVVICGLGINIEKQIPNLIKRVEHLGKYFKDWRFVIFENDSTDNTRELLSDWSDKNYKVDLIKCIENKNCKLNKTKATEDGIVTENRMKKMVDYRNRVINHIKNNYLDFDYVLLFDLDIRGPWSINGIANSFGKHSEWDMITAYGINGITLSLGQPFYYDLIAYTDNKYDMSKNFLNFLPIYFKTNYNNSYVNKQELISCNSAFSGMCILKMNILKNDVNYTPLDNKYKCEHIIFCDNMRNKGFNKIKINPNMLVLVGPQGDTKNYPFY